MNQKLLRIRKLSAIIFVFAVFIIVFRFVILPEVFFPKKYSEYVEIYSNEFGLETNLVYAIIKTESSFNTDAESHMSAKGLMQVTETTGQWGADELGINDFDSQTDLYSPEINIRIGCWYISRLINQYDSEEVALAAYNAGSGNVSKWLKNKKYSDDGKTLDNIPFGETERYVEKVINIKNIYDYLYNDYS